jgi:uncharacterized membrane protein YjjP (DUF1212 family)
MRYRDPDFPGAGFLAMLLTTLWQEILLPTIIIVTVGGIAYLVTFLITRDKTRATIAFAIVTSVGFYFFFLR